MFAALDLASGAMFYRFRDRKRAIEFLGFLKQLRARIPTWKVQAGVPARWVTGHEVYGADPKLRASLVSAGISYLLAIAKHHPILTGIGVRKAVELVVRLPKSAWQRRSAGAGAKGE